MSKVINFKEKKKKKEKKRMIIILLLVVIAIYILITIYLITKTSTDTVTIDKGSLTFEESAIGYIIRDETVVKGSKYKNGIYQIVFEGEKAAKNQAIYRYYGDNEKQIEDDIEKVNKKIQTALKKETTFFSSDIKNIEDQIEIKIKSIANVNDLQKISETRKEISDLMIKKAKIAGDLSPKGSYIKKIISQKEELEKKLTSGSEIIKAPKSGVISYRVDGLENVLTPQDFSGLTQNKLENLDIKTGKIVSANNESAKVIDNFLCYVATIIDSNVAKNSTEGSSVKLTLSSGKELNATIVQKKRTRRWKNINCI